MMPLNTAHVDVALTSQSSYRIYIGEECLYDVVPLLNARAGAAAFLITNPTVFKLYGARLLATCKKARLRAVPLLVPQGERFKTLRTAARLYNALIEHKAERSAVIMALGGGVIGDLAGFVAATYLRGINLVHLPTTLLAQVDSSVGGKAGVNHTMGKNLIGAFYHPNLVWTDVATLDSLPEREFRQGLHEVVKYGVIADGALFERMEEQLPAVLARERGILTEIIQRCCRIKADIVAADERENGPRIFLNFGHTVGHALETVTAYRVFKHGEAVGWGMMAAARLAQRLGMLPPADGARIERMVQAVGARPSLGGLPINEIIAAMQHDKKVRGGDVHWILPSRIGEVSIRSDVPLRIVQTVLQGLVV
ncbi:MAG: 3-dehydroquinate synthase [Acidobacteria bacterium]|nr:3-dehydroquinate synthase [Acidobacteriota bacterium]MBI3655816.1 3-dehydroquinate synthase [Acidobacteriota bacterium]